MNIGVFDMDWQGHHPAWIPPTAEALSTVGDVTLYLSASLAERCGDLTGRVEILPDSALEPEAQFDALRTIAESGSVDHILHMYGVKPVLREWLRRPELGVPSSVVVTHASMLHFPSHYATRLTLPERANAWYKENLIRRWTQRRDAHSIFTMDLPAVERWNRRGARAYFWPEPPVTPPQPIPDSERRGFVVCGALVPGKNIAGIARALSVEPTDVELVIAGEPLAAYVPALHAEVEEMRAAGVTVDLRARWHTSAELTNVLQHSRCLLAPYLRQKGTSHTLIEAAAAGTPVIAHKTGLFGHTVEAHGLGMAIDCADPRALRDAILQLAADDRGVSRYAAALERFAELHSAERFRAAVTAPFIQA